MGFAAMGLDFEALCVGKAKDVVTVSKASAVAEYLSNRDDLVLIICYEEAFDKVDEKTQYMWLRMAMDQIVYDYEKDKIVIGVPSITIPVDFYDKYKEAAINSAVLAQLTIAQIEDERKQKKLEEQAQKKGKKNKRF